MRNQSPKARMRLYVLWGQSHMYGTKSFVDGFPEAQWNRFGPPIPGAYIWDKLGRPNRSNVDLSDALRGNEPHAWKPLGAGFGTGGPDYPWEDPTTNPSFGPEMQMAHALRAQTGESVALVKFAVGGSQLANLADVPNWNVNRLGAGNASLLQILLEAYLAPALEQAKVLCEEQGLELSLGGVVSMIGTSDARRPADAQAYGANLLDCIDHVRQVLNPPHPELVPWLVLQTPRYVGPDGEKLAFLATVRSAQAQAASARPAVEVRDTVDFRLTGTHFEPRGTAGLGQTMFRWAMRQVPLA